MDLRQLRYFHAVARFESLTAASEALNVTIGLLERGYDEDAIGKIWGGNFVRVWRAAEALTHVE